MSLLTYTHEGRIWDTSVSFAPRFHSSAVALALVAPLYLRRILNWNRSLYSIASFILILAFFASLVELALGGNTRSALIMPVLAIAVAVSWLGLREIAGASWLLVLLAGSLAAVGTNLALGIFGFIYIACGILGLSLHAGLNPGQIVSGLMREYVHPSRSVTRQISQDIASVGKR